MGTLSPLPSIHLPHPCVRESCGPSGHEGSEKPQGRETCFILFNGSINKVICTEGALSSPACTLSHPTHTHFLVIPIWKTLEEEHNSIGSPTSWSWRAYANLIIPWADFKDNPARSVISILVQFKITPFFFFSLIHWLFFFF